MNIDEEIPLAGGNVNGDVVRVGETVRRQLTAASPLVHELLLHLETKGFSGAPRFLGIDEKGRENLSFLPGETGIPDSIWQQDEPLIATANLLKGYHNALLDFRASASAEWAYYYPDVERHEVICHNDFAPYNLVYTDGVPTAVIDFDLAGPGPRLRDVAYAVFWMVPLSFNSEDQLRYTEADVSNGSRRLNLFCETYGIPAGSELLTMVGEVLVHMGNEAQMRRMVGDDVADKLVGEGHLAHWQREARAFEMHRARIEANLAE